MKPTEHTPGPWTVVPGHGYKIVQWKGNAREDLPNIRLIAAAPELLEALEKLTQRHRVDPVRAIDEFWDADFEAAQKAIDKAKGGIHE